MQGGKDEETYEKDDFSFLNYRRSRILNIRVIKESLNKFITKKTNTNNNKRTLYSEVSKLNSKKMFKEER